MKKILLLITFVFQYFILPAQNIVIQQNSNQTQQEKVVIKEKVPVYVEKPSTELTKPVLIYGYLYVYPTDLGSFRVQNFPYAVIANINKAKAYGRSNWRLPTKEELELMREADGGSFHHLGKLRLAQGIGSSYMAQTTNGTPIPRDLNDYYSPDSFQVIRLVSSN